MVYFIICAVIIAVDYFVKKWAMGPLREAETIPVIKDVFHLTYVENTGVAFGMFKNQRFVFILITVLILAALIYFMLRHKNKPRLLNTGLCFMTGGAVGNLIDRIHLGFVVDLFDFRLISFPVFNVADIFVCLGAAIMAVFFIFFDKDKKEDEH